VALWALGKIARGELKLRDRNGNLETLPSNTDPYTAARLMAFSLLADNALATQLGREWDHAVEKGEVQPLPELNTPQVPNANWADNLGKFAKRLGILSR
jgi:hypothetical protein